MKMNYREGAEVQLDQAATLPQVVLAHRRVLQSPELQEATVDLLVAAYQRVVVALMEEVAALVCLEVEVALVLLVAQAPR